MKKFSFSTILAITVVLILTTSALAEATNLPGSGWWTAEQIQNVQSCAGTCDATVNVSVYDSTNNANVYYSSKTIAKGASYTFVPADFPTLPSNFKGSAVVSSNGDIRAIGSVTNRYVSGLGDSLTPSAANGQYTATVNPSTTLLFPLVKNNYGSKTTSFAIQNAGSNATTFTATFKLPTSTADGAPIGTYTYTSGSIEPGRMVMITPSMAKNGSNQAPVTGVKGSLTVTSNSTEALAGTYLEYFTTETHATVLQSTSAFTPSEADNTVFAPSNKKVYSKRWSALQIQNAETSGTVDIQVTYKGAAGTACAGGTYYDSKTGLPAGESVTFLSTDIAGMPDGCLSAATIVSTGGKVVAAVVESFYGAYRNSAGKQESTTYKGIPANQATNVISLPLFKEYSSGKAIAAVVQNITDDTATVVFTFKNSSGQTFVSNPVSIPGKTGYTLFEVRLKDASFWNGTAMTPTALGCTATQTGCGSKGVFSVIANSTNSKAIVAITNETTYPLAAPYFNMDKGNYEGFNLTAAP